MMENNQIKGVWFGSKSELEALKKENRKSKNILYIVCDGKANFGSIGVI
jgi:hypothetical protein